MTVVAAGGSALRRLITPLDPAEFFARHWERRPLHISAAGRDSFADVLSIDAIEKILSDVNRQPLPFTVVSAGKELKRSEYIRDDNSVDIVRLFQLFGEGYTVVLNQLHLKHEPMAAFCQALALEFSMPVQCNAYLSPPDSKGFKPHYDTHDVFILQLVGAKEWRIYEPLVAFPMRGQAFQPDADEMGKLAHTFELKTGEAVYIPRGWGHEGRTAAETSLHATIGILSFTWAELLIEAVSVACLRDGALREALPVGFAQPGFDKDKARARFTALWQKLQSDIDADAAFAHFAGRLVDSAAPDMRGQLRALQSVDALSIESLAGVRANALYALRRTQDKIVIRFQGRTIELPAPCGPGVEHALASPCFRIADLPGELDGDAKLTLVRRLIREGLLTAKEPDRQA